MTFIAAKGATTIDPSDLKITATNQAELDAFEFDNIYAAEKKYLHRRKYQNASWFQIKFLQEVHFSMFGQVWNWAGKFRKTNVLPIGVEPFQIVPMMAELIRDVEYWQNHSTGMPFVEMSARIHHRLAFIHPFPNGNGRFSRFISNLFLFSYGCSLPTWPSGMNREGHNRTSYLTALRNADRGNIDPLIKFITSLGARNPETTM